MNYSSFCDSLCEELSRLFEESTEIIRQQIQKNNGITLDALCIRSQGAACSPVVYLKPLYQYYTEGRDISDIARSVLHSLSQEMPITPEALFETQNLNAVRGKIAYRLVSRSYNRELLKEVPWVPFLDLAVIFYLRLDAQPDHQLSTCVNNLLADKWHLAADELFRIATENTPSLMPPVLNRLEDLLAGILPSLPGVSGDLFSDTSSTGHADTPATAPDSGAPASDTPASPPELYLLTNETGIYGASCLLYEGIIKDFADQMEADVLILPSSIHEVLLVPDHHTLNYSEFQEMVRAINAEDVPKEDLLSDEIYLYSRSTCSFKIWHSPSWHDTPETGGRRNP